MKNSSGKCWKCNKKGKLTVTTAIDGFKQFYTCSYCGATTNINRLPNLIRTNKSR